MISKSVPDPTPQAYWRHARNYSDELIDSCRMSPATRAVYFEASQDLEMYVDFISCTLAHTHTHKQPSRTKMLPGMKPGLPKSGRLNWICKILLADLTAQVVLAIAAVSDAQMTTMAAGGTPRLATLPLTTGLTSATGHRRASKTPRRGPAGRAGLQSPPVPLYHVVHQPSARRSSGGSFLCCT